MNKDSLWKIILGEMELSLSKANFTTWFKNTSIYDLQKDKLVINVPHVFAKEWLEKKYKKNILASAQKQFPQITDLSCVVGLGEKPTPKTNLDSVQTTQQNTPLNLKTKRTPSVTPPDSSRLDSNINPRYSFDNFIVGTNNELAYAACQAIAKDPGKTYNPLFIYGGVGLGKTHLLQSVGNQLISNFPQLKVRYLSMERFANELVDAIQNKHAKEFKNNYIKLGVLILDDIQFLAGREKTQEEFFHVFESLYQMGKQIILSSDRSPKAIPTIEDRLRSRFEGGMMADISAPDLETRLAIINQKLSEKNFSFNDEIIHYLAENIHHNVRELEGAVNKIIVTCQLSNHEPTINEIMELTKDIISLSRQKDVSPEKILTAVAKYYDLKTEEITGRCRKKKVIRPRQITIYLLRKELNLSYPEVGEVLGGRDHSTAIYAFKKISKDLEKNNDLKKQLSIIKEKFISY